MGHLHAIVKDIWTKGKNILKAIYLLPLMDTFLGAVRGGAMCWECVTSDEHAFGQCKRELSMVKNCLVFWFVTASLLAILPHFLKCPFKRESTADCGGVFIT